MKYVDENFPLPGPGEEYKGYDIGVKFELEKAIESWDWTSHLGQLLDGRWTIYPTDDDGRFASIRIHEFNFQDRG